MKFSSRARYALRSMIEIAQRAKASKPVSLKEVARSTQLPRRYLEQLAIALRRAALVRSVSGRGGGYVLARPAKEITIREIIEAAIGPINIVDCVRQPETCLKADVCECRVIYMLINERITEVLNACSLADMADNNCLNSMAQELGQGFQPFGLEQTSTEGTLGSCPARETEGPKATA